MKLSCARIYSLLLVSLIVLTSPFYAIADNSKTLLFADTGIAGLEELQRQFGEFQKVLSEKSGYTIKFMPVTSRTAVVEALRSKKLDLALTGPAEYVVIRKRTSAFPIVGLVRPDYFSDIVVLASGPIKSLTDLKGKRVAFGDVGSTSYHLAPMQILKDNNIDPLKDISAMHIAKQIAWDALKKGDVAAIGFGNERFVQFREQEKELDSGSFRVIARGPDLPNDLIIAGAHVAPEAVEAIKKAFRENQSEMASAILAGSANTKYGQMKFVTDIQDHDYDYVRSMYITAGFPEYSEFVGEG
ncbi:MAG: PhnD/SsuA/transferrin family substrate-binding protein [Bdellovibrionales bacterium]|nr:PhnD/SsuA/transferrin family substrate-binding protein [Bdellovibrionales bacterium]